MLDIHPASRRAAPPTFALILLAFSACFTTPAQADAPARHGHAAHRERAHLPQPADARRYVMPPHSRVAGRTIGEWAAAHWQWTFSFLDGASPVFDDQTGELAWLGDVGGPVFFAAAADDVHRRFDLRCGQYLLVPLADQAWTLEGSDTVEFARAQNDEFVASVTSLVARLDGRRIPDLYSHLESTPELFPVTIPDGGLFGPEGGSFEAVAAGYFLMLRPLPPGRHTLTFGATALGGAFEYRARFDFDVVGPCPRR